MNWSQSNWKKIRSFARLLKRGTNRQYRTRTHIHTKVLVLSTRFHRRCALSFTRSLAWSHTLCFILALTDSKYMSTEIIQMTPLPMTFSGSTAEWMAGIVEVRDSLHTKILEHKLDRVFFSHMGCQSVLHANTNTQLLAEWIDSPEDLSVFRTHIAVEFMFQNLCV